MLCILASGCFFSGASAARWWRLECKRLFAFYKNYFVIFCNARHNLNEFGSALIYAKKCDRKKQQQGGLCGSRQKDRASPKVRGAGIFGGW